MTSAGSGFTGPTQLLALELEGETAERALFALPPEPGLPALFGDDFPGATFLCHDYAVYRRDLASARADVTCLFASSPETGAAHGMGVLFLPKGKDLIEMMCRAMSAAVAPGAPVLIVGPKRSAIRSSRGGIEEWIGPIEDQFAARHSVLLRARCDRVSPPLDVRAEFVAEAFGIRVTAVTLPGVFSYGRLDEGTRMLLEHLGGPPFGSALDLGCGSGVIAAALKRADPAARVDAVDSHAQALHAARLTLAANGLEARVWASDGLSDVTDRYDLIACNPPFHTGPDTEVDTALGMIRDAAAHLAPGGRLVVVANAHLPYLPAFHAAFARVEVVAETTRFRVIEAREPLA